MKCFFSLYTKITILQITMISQSSITKQTLINNINLSQDILCIIKDLVFYDKVSQLTRKRKDNLICQMRLGSGYSYFEGTAIQAEQPGIQESVVVNIRYVNIDYDNERFLLQYVVCYKCGNYDQTQSVLTPQTKCHCNLEHHRADEEEEDAYEVGPIDYLFI